jgi:16S rRNA (cytosine1402-N4)-methyltransferase
MTRDGPGPGREGALFHEPVLVEQVLEYLDPRDGGLYLDGTVGGGGHAQALLERCPDCRLLAVDRDAEALARAREVLAPYRSRVRFLRERFDRAVGDPEVRDRGLAGALLDLGVSSHQLDVDARGFAFRPGVVLDMRMDRSQEEDAAAFLARAGEEELGRVFRELGEERRGRRLAREVVKRRSGGAVTTSDDLVAALTVVLRRPPSAREKARIFQAVRIAVNRELETLEEALPALRDVLREGGVLAVIAYHSLEDRIVKHTFRAWSRACVCPPELPACACRGESLGETLTRKPVVPSEAEVGRNPRARSARLRAWRKAA